MELDKDFIDKLNHTLAHVFFGNRKELVLNQPKIIDGHLVSEDGNWLHIMEPFIGDEEFKVRDFVRVEDFLVVRIVRADIGGRRVYRLTHTEAFMSLTGYAEFFDAIMSFMDDKYVETCRVEEITHEPVKEKQQEDPLWGSW